VIELVQMPKQQPLDQDAEDADEQRRHKQHQPIINAKIGQAHPRKHRSHHVESAMRKVDDVQQAKNDRQSERQHRVKRAIDQPEQQLAQQRRQRTAEYLH
jgi:hypothetical protein